MKPKELLSTVYLGDRACKKFLIDGWNRRFAIQVDCISRIEKGTSEWNYYTDEDVKDGWLVFSGMKSLSIMPDGFVPNDFIEIISVYEVGEETAIEISVGSVSTSGETTEIQIRVVAEMASIESTDYLLSVT